MYDDNFPTKRYHLTLDFVKQHISKSEKILDLGVKNPLSELLKSNGFSVANTNGEDLDLDYSCVQNSSIEVVTAFEILEHLVSPFTILKEIKAKKTSQGFICFLFTLIKQPVCLIALKCKNIYTTLP
mgnify:CR=1 FL=1